MKTKFILIALLCMQHLGYSQYLGVRARYTGTRLVDNPPYEQSRENRLILSFWYVDAAGNYTPANMINHDVYIYKGGLQFGSGMGGVLDSAGNNYPGYPYTAPAVVSYYNTYGDQHIDCDPNAATKYTVNGHELDCGWIGVSYWLYDEQVATYGEYFTAPNVCLPWYTWPHPYSFAPGNVNFGGPNFAGPYNHYNFTCAGSSLQLVHRGLMPFDSSTTALIPLAVGFADVSAVRSSSLVRVGFSNRTETDVERYEVQRSADGFAFQNAGLIFPSANNGRRSDYIFLDSTASSGRLFYRIKAVETNGAIKFSTVVSVDAVLPTAGLSVFPNPVTNHLLNFQITNARQGIYRVQLINAAGQVSFIKNIQHSGGLLSGSVDLPVLLQGVYYLSVQSAASSFSSEILLR